jgi:acetyl/propionyl-CoA carboxylase alpha subunit
VAQGEALPMKQSDVRISGHAIEFRIYAEDPSANFAPSKGRIQNLKRPTYEFVREDHGIENGDEVSLYYDAMLSKLIVRGDTRKEAIERSIKALREYQIEGLATTLPFHRWLLINSPFVSGPLDIGYLGRHFNPASLRDLEASEIKDDRHRAPIAQAEYREELRYVSRAYSAEYVIEVLHQDGGFFLARPINSDGVKAPLRYCRRSNGFAAAVKALTVDVLEKVEPGELFS